MTILNFGVKKVGPYLDILNISKLLVYPLWLFTGLVCCILRLQTYYGFNILWGMGLMVWVFSWIGLLGFICPLYGTLGRSKFEFVQDLPSLYQPARYQRVPTRSYGNPVSYSVKYVALTRLTYDKGQYS